MMYIDFPVFPYFLISDVGLAGHISAQEDAPTRAWFDS